MSLRRALIIFFALFAAGAAVGLAIFMPPQRPLFTTMEGHRG